MMRAMPSLLALLSLFLFPWQASALMLAVASAFFPPAGVMLGIIADLAYYQPGAAFLPWFSLYGIFLTAGMLLVHRFVKTRIMEG